MLDVTAIIVSPNLNSGFNMGNNQFVWGHNKGLHEENYDLVYLVHESLLSYFLNTNLTHAIIENIADIELAKYLNNSEVSYGCYDFTKILHLQILPFWNLYLNKNQESIEKESRQNNIFYNLKDFAKYQSILKSMNVDDFVKFLEQLNLKDLLDIKHSYSISMKNI